MARVVFRDARIYLIQWLTKIRHTLSQRQSLNTDKEHLRKIARAMFLLMLLIISAKMAYSLWRYFSFSAEYTAVSSSANKPLRADAKPFDKNDVQLVSQQNWFGKYQPVAAPVKQPESAPVAESLWEFIDEDRSVQTRLGREDSEYLARSVPFYAANQPLADISEMRVVQGMDAGLYQKLKPLVCALPMARQQININTLDVTQSVILEALFDPWLSPVQARALLQQRPAKGWEDVDQFLAQPLLADVDERTKKQLKTVLSVDSNYFWLRSDITVNEIELTMNSLIVRMGPQHFSVLWHQTGESE